MKQLAQGPIGSRIAAAGNSMYPGYVIRGDGKSLMIDAGINLLGPLYCRSLDEILGERARLDYLFVTHSHYDHLGSLHYLKRRIPRLVTGAHERVAPLLGKESVLALMNALSDVQREAFGDIAGDEDLTIVPTPIDLTLREGDEIDLGGLACRVYETPGHTKDSLAYYVPEIQALFPGEAAGVPQGVNGEEVQVGFLSSYEDYLASLEKLMKLDTRILCIGHGLVFTGDDASIYLRKSRAATSAYRSLIESYLDRTHGDVDKTVETMTRKEYDEKGTIRQERNAYITNLKAQVRLIAGL